MKITVIEIDQALKWINWEFPSEISSSTRYWIGRIGDGSIADGERKDTIADLIKLVGRLPNPLEQAEILSFCGAYGYLLGLIEEAVGWLQKAADMYEYCRDQHRHATALWMLYIVQRGLGKYRQAFDLARRSRKLFIAQAEDRLVKKRTEEESWYRGRIQDMTCDLVSSPEDMFECLFEFGGSNLSPSAAQMKNHIASEVEQVDQDDYLKTKNEIKLFLDITRRSARPEETAEALAFCGVVSWVLEDKVGAVKFFRTALSYLLPASFEYAVLQWMLGLALFAFPTENASAIVTMEASIEGFDRLRQKAIQENKMTQRDWFAIHHIAMKRVFRTRVEGM